MPEKNQIFSSKLKYDGIFSFKDFYKFCYDFLKEDLDFDVVENKYKEKLTGDSKEIDIEWKGERKISDYFKYEIKVEFQIKDLTNIEIEQAGKKRKTNKGSVEVKIKGSVVADYKGEYETKPILRFMRSIYEKWIIPSKIEQVEDKLIGKCDEFLGQAKAYLDLEGKR